MAPKDKSNDETKPPAAAGTAQQAGQAAGDDAVILGAAKVPIKPGGPGAGAAQTARPVEGAVTAPLTDQAAADLGLRGPLAPLTDIERAELRRLQGEIDPERFQLELLRGRKAGLVVDAKDIPGTRLAEALTFIKRNGVEYSPAGERWVPVDFNGYTELVQIGAIADTPFHELEPVASAAGAEED